MSGCRAEIVEPILRGVRETSGPLLQLGVVLDLCRPIEPAPLASAVAALLRAFPILACRYERRFLRDRWVPGPAPAGLLREERGLSAEGVEARTRFHLGDPIDPDSAPPLRVVHLGSPGRSRLLIVYTHLVGDGNAGLTLAGMLGRFLDASPPEGEIPMDRSFLQWARALPARAWPTLLAEFGRELFKPLLLPWLGTWCDARSLTPPPGGGVLVRRFVLRGPSAERFTAALRRGRATVNDGLVALAVGVGARCSTRRWTGAAYTVNLRRYLEGDAPRVANLSGVNLLVVRRERAGDFPALLDYVARRTGEQKRRLPGVATTLPAFFLGWFPHGVLRRIAPLLFADWARAQLRKLVLMTNVGSMDSYLAPFGGDLVDAWMAGPFLEGLPAPIAIASGFRGSFTIAVCGGSDFDPAAASRVLGAWASEVGRFA